jgi:hypothetical protein
MSPHPDEPMTYYIRPPDMTQAEVEKLVTIIVPSSSSADEHQQGTMMTEQEAKEQVRQLIQEVCNRNVDRTTDYPYFLMVLVHASVTTTTTSNSDDAMTLLLFSDHTFSDGCSGMVVLHDLLSNLGRLILLQHQVDVDTNDNELLLGPTMYEQVRGSRIRLWQRMLDAILVGIGSKFVAREMTHFRPIFPNVREDQMDTKKGELPLPINPSYFLMDSGTKENLKKALEKCREEQVTLNGAMV